MLVAQNTTVSLWEENLEQLSMDGEERNWEDELEELSRRLQEPININVATKRQLEEFPFLTAFQIEHLLAYVYVHGQMQTVYELQLVEGMDKRTIELLLPFICIKYPPGGHLDSVRDMAAAAGVHPNTMQRALAQLEAEGLVYTERTTGRFVTEDTALLEQLRDETARAMTAEYLEKMRGIGYVRAAEHGATKSLMPMQTDLQTL